MSKAGGDNREPSRSEHLRMPHEVNVLHSSLTRVADIKRKEKKSEGESEIKDIQHLDISAIILP